MPWYSHLVDIIVPTTRTANAASIADHTDSQPFPAPFADDTYQTVVLAKTVTLAPHAPTQLLVKSIGSRERSIESINNSAIRASLHVAGEEVKAISNRPFHTLLTNLSNKPVHNRNA